MVQNQTLDSIAKDVFRGMWPEAGITACLAPLPECTVRWTRTRDSIAMEVSDYMEGWPEDLVRLILVRMRDKFLGGQPTDWTRDELLQIQAAMGPTAQARWVRRHGELEWYGADGIKVAESPTLVHSRLFRRFAAPRTWLEDEETMTAIRAWYDGTGPIPEVLQDAVGRRASA